jgi:hypothetical protein
VYGILMAIPFFHENKEMDWQFYIGAGIILLSVFAHPLLRSRFEKKEEMPIH